VREIDEALVPQRHAIRTATEHRQFGVVAQAALRYIAQVLEGVHVLAQERRQVGASNELHIQLPRPTEHQHERPNERVLPSARSIAEPDIDLLLVARRRFEPHGRLHRRWPPYRLNVLLEQAVELPALPALRRIHERINFLHPVRILVGKTRTGPRVTRRYDVAQKPLSPSS
jgi:hypothetical protein